MGIRPGSAGSKGFMNRLGERVGVSLLGLLGVVLVLEGALRLVGFAHRSSVDLPEGSAFTVLCEGDSFTYGSGAPTGQDWPTRLQGLLEARGVPSTVVNHGELSATTSVVRDHLQSDLAGHPPDLVLILAGGANYSDYRGLFAWSDSHGLASRAQEALWRLRTWRLLRFLTRDLVQQDLVPREALKPGADQRGPPPSQACPPHAVQIVAQSLALREAGDGEGALSLLQKGTGSAPRCLELWQQSLFLLLQAGRVDEALASLVAEWKANPGQPVVYQDAVFTFTTFGQSARAAAALEAWVQAEPDGYPERCLSLATLYENVGDLERARSWYQACPHRPDMACASAWGKVKVAFRSGDREAGSAALRTFGRTAMPRCPDYGGIVGSLCAEGMDREAVAWFQEALKGDAREWFPLLRSVQPCLGEGDVEQVRALLLSRVPESDVVNTVMDHIARGRSMQERVDPWLESELLAMVETVQVRRIPVVLATYPNPGRVNGRIRQVARDAGVPLVDHEQAFQAELARGLTRADLFVGDSSNPVEPTDHCNARGYERMAEEVLKVLEESGLLPDG